jgi:hypothetical protein
MQIWPRRVTGHTQKPNQAGQEIPGWPNSTSPTWPEGCIHTPSPQPQHQRPAVQLTGTSLPCRFRHLQSRDPCDTLNAPEIPSNFLLGTIVSPFGDIALNRCVKTSPEQWATASYLLSVSYANICRFCDKPGILRMRGAGALAPTYAIALNCSRCAALLLRRSHRDSFCSSQCAVIHTRPNADEVYVPKVIDLQFSDLHCEEMINFDY